MCELCHARPKCEDVCSKCGLSSVCNVCMLRHKCKQQQKINQAPTVITVRDENIITENEVLKRRLSVAYTEALEQLTQFQEQSEENRLKLIETYEESLRILREENEKLHNELEQIKERASLESQIAEKKRTIETCRNCTERSRETREIHGAESWEVINRGKKIQYEEAVKSDRTPSQTRQSRALKTAINGLIQINREQKNSAVRASFRSRFKEKRKEIINYLCCKSCSVEINPKISFI
jgi:hypothetical protein